MMKVTKERVFRGRADKEPRIGRQGIKRTKESEALDEFTHKGIYGDHTFCFEYAEWHMNRQLIRTGRAKAVGGQIGTLTDAHAGVANQQKGIATQIVAAQELLLQELILLCCERTRKSVREARHILAADQMSEFRELFCPSQFVADAAETDEADEIGCGCERRHLRAQAGHPAEDVRLTMQLVEALHLRMIGAEIAQEVAGRPAVLTSGLGTECHAEGIDRAVEDRSQRMLERRPSRPVHEKAFGRGRMGCATPAAYSRETSSGV